MTIANDLTAVVVTRHGHGTTALTIDGLHRQSVRPGRVLVADIASPDRVAERLSTDSRVEHIRFDQLVSRQEARRRCLEEVDTELVLLLDNNMLLADGAIDAMLAAAAETGAVQVGPLVATRGGSVHYSGGVFERARSLSSLGRRIASRRQDAGGQFLTPVEEIQGGRKEIEFVESHCGLARTEALRRPGVLVESMHNAHTMCFAGYRLSRTYHERSVLEPSAVAEIVPLGFGYDLPWMLLEYLRRDRLALSYRNLRCAIGRGPNTDLAQCIGWHAKHCKYLLLGMLEGDRWDREDLATADEIPASMAGYDLPLPEDTDRRLRAELRPRVEARFPDLLPPLDSWLRQPH